MRCSGHCIAIDPWFIASQAQDITPLIQTARRVNLNKTQWVINKINYIIERFKKENGLNLWLVVWDYLLNLM